MKTWTMKAVAATALTVVSLLAASGAQATLLGRDLNNDGTYDAYYDNVLNISWLADANYAMTSGRSATGRLLWSEAMDWAGQLNIYGVSAWRLPTLAPINGSAFLPEFSNNATTDTGTGIEGLGWANSEGTPVSELGWMYYGNLGGVNAVLPSGFVVPGSCANWVISGSAPNFCLPNSGPFSNIQRTAYWANLESFMIPSSPVRAAFVLDMDIGYQQDVQFGNSLFAWAVHDGDVGGNPVPAPGTLALLVAGFLGWMGVKRSRHRAGA